jgi:hypothetical protein
LGTVQQRRSDGQFTESGVGVEKGTKGVISAHFSVHGQQTFNNLQTKLPAKTKRKGFFNTHRRLRS